MEVLIFSNDRKKGWQLSVDFVWVLLVYSIAAICIISGLSIVDIKALATLNIFLT